MASEAIPTAGCPITGRPIILPSRIWHAKRPIRVNCPVCGEAHLWDPTSQMLTAPSHDDLPT